MSDSPDGSEAAPYLSALIHGFWTTQVINAAARLELADALAEGPQTLDSLARRAGACEPSLLRLLRALHTLRIVARRADGRYELTPAGQLLRAEVPGSLRGRALFSGDMLYRQFSDLTEVVRSGSTTRAIASGVEGFARLAEDPQRLHAFQSAMAESSIRVARDVLEVYDFSRFERVLDLGGGYGGVLSVLLARYPHLMGAVCDLGYLAERARGFLERSGVGTRAQFVAGDFFSSVPPGYDGYVLKFVIHDWDDERAARILRNCRAAAAPGTRLVLLEQLVPDDLGTEAADQAVTRADLTMLAMGGKERTAAEYRALCASAGWRATQIVPARDGFSVLEAVPA